MYHPSSHEQIHNKSKEQLVKVNLQKKYNNCNELFFGIKPGMSVKKANTSYIEGVALKQHFGNIVGISEPSALAFSFLVCHLVCIEGQITLTNQQRKLFEELNKACGFKVEQNAQILDFDLNKNKSFLAYTSAFEKNFHALGAEEVRNIPGVLLKQALVGILFEQRENFDADKVAQALKTKLDVLKDVFKEGYSFQEMFRGALILAEAELVLLSDESNLLVLDDICNKLEKMENDLIKTALTQPAFT